VIGHQAIGVEQVVVICGCGDQIFDQPVPDGMIVKDGLALVGAEGYEVGLFAEVGRWWKADGFTAEHFGRTVA
jgi:hypothetical protein